MCFLPAHIRRAKIVGANDTKSAKKKKPKLKPSAAGSIWKGGARERADGVFFCRRHKKTSEQSGLCSDVVRLMRFERTTFRVGV